jgi:ribosomal protein S18 acetylase RimI-like enzyme
MRAFPDDPPWNAPREIIRHKREVQPDLFWVGVSESRIVATVMAGYDGNRGRIYHLAVAPDLRRKGFGRVMMAQAEERLRGLGCPNVNLQIRSSDVSVVAFTRPSLWGVLLIVYNLAARSPLGPSGTAR